MGEVIRSNAAAEDIEADILETARNAAARGGEIAAAAETRLGPAVEAIGSSKALLGAAQLADSLAWAPVEVENGKSDKEIGKVRDEMWNALGRPKDHPAMNAAIPGGIKTYTEGDIKDQPPLMGVFATRIRATAAPMWSEAAREAWATGITVRGGALEAVLAAHAPPAAAETVAAAGYRSAIRNGHAKLVMFKRDLFNLGLTETQAHEIIPDAETRPAKKKPADDEPKK